MFNTGRFNHIRFNTGTSFGEEIELEASVSAVSSIEQSLSIIISISTNVECISNVVDSSIEVIIPLETEVEAISDAMASMFQDLMILGQIGSAASLTAGLTQTISFTSILNPISDITVELAFLTDFECIIAATSNIANTTFDKQPTIESEITSESSIIASITYYNYFESDINAISSIDSILGIDIPFTGTIDAISSISGQYYTLFIDAQFAGVTDYIRLVWTEG